MTMVLRYSSFVIVLLFLYNISFSKALKSGFTVELIHRDSPKSPFYRPTETQFERVQNAILRSIDRANHFSYSTKAPNLNDAESTIIPNSGEYLMSYSVGNPPFQTLGLADTGSSTVWMQCQPCKNCFKQNRPIFDPSNSSSYETLPCVAAECLAAPNAYCSWNNGRHCAYKVRYGDGSVSVGDLSVDSVTLTSSDGGPIEFPEIVFGCGHENSGIFSQQTSGIVGLGNGPISLATQLRPLTKGKFSYCLTPMFEGKIQSSKLHFGDAAEVSGYGAVSTPIVTKSDHPFFYYLNLEAISVANKKIEIDNDGVDGNIVIDSGTPLTFLTSTVFSDLKAAVADEIELEPTDDPWKRLQLCYKIKPGQLYQNLIPPIIAHFEGGADVILHSVNSFVKRSEEVICLAFISSSKSIFGSLAQQDLLVGYDQLKNRVTFKATDCTTEL